MKLNSSVIFVKDIERACYFYEKVLCLKVEHDFGKNVIFEGGLAIWQLNAEHVIAQKLQIHARCNRFELYFEDPNIEGVYNRLLKEGVEFLHPIKQEMWGQKTIRFFDHDHHLIEIGEPLEVFVRNMYLEGLSISEIVEKSGIVQHTIVKLLGV